MDLSHIFDNGSKFDEFKRYRMQGQIDGRNVGVVLATKNKGYDTFALNCADLERLTAAKNNGKVDEAYVVFAKVIDFNTRVYCGQWTLEETQQKMGLLQPRGGRFGEFLVIPPGVAPEEDDPWM
jgi:hypothetical protein